ncbi:single-stranded DNA-binding protein WHY1, chloroplastic-like isoform X2 [Malus sylvestris]|uniref:single-stranded DNA-binding protein WHY1, chloroplastic-like isoform X2 n=1 Tax=Malus sylvestris TaxID=3752 RepID=UPI0021AC6C08|nr:single-stranded DNA-binding protein WHY1, chloroplastic-like isoform X2 [Malus sylvestris]
MLKLHSLSSPATAQNPHKSPSQLLSSQLSSRGRVFSTNTFGFAPSPSSSTKRLSLKCRQSEYFDQQRTSTGASPNKPSPGSQTPAGVTGMPPRIYVGHSIYKGKAALTVEPKAPEFTPLDSGAFKLSREGFVLLQFAPAAGVRVYDWSRKQVFSLSVTEIGSLVSLGSKESLEFFHDPFKGKSDEGKVRKVLKVEPLPDGSGHFFNLVTGMAPRIYVGHSIYKGKAALTVEPKAPEFTPLDSGAFKLSREGFVLLQFAPAAGVRVYDWSRKQVFSLSVTEIGSLVSLGSKESLEFFHDPFKGKSDEGKVRKVLKVEPLPDGSGHFFNLIYLAVHFRLACLCKLHKTRRFGPCH